MMDIDFGTLIEDIDEELKWIIEEEDDCVQREEFEYKGILVDVEEISLTTSLIKLDCGGKILDIPTNRMAKSWESFKKRYIVIRGMRSLDEEDSVCQISFCVGMDFDKELGSFFSGADLPKYRNVRDTLSKEKYIQLMKDYEKLVPESLPEEKEELPVRFSSFEELCLRYAVLRSQYPSEIRLEVEQCIQSYNRIGTSTAEKNVLRRVLYYLLYFDYNRKAILEKSITEILRYLNASHAGLNGAKNSMVKEYNAVLHSSNKKAPRCLLFVGGSGCGKTSLAMSFASAIGVKYELLNLGAIEGIIGLVGSSRCYENSSTGMFFNKLFHLGSKGMFILDEVDKISNQDQVGILLEMLDGRYRNEMLEVTLDVSGIWFIATANSVRGISPALLNRMTVIPFEEYTEDEICRIASEKVLPEMCREFGMEVTFSEDAILEIYHEHSAKNSIRDMRDAFRRIFSELIYRGKNKEHITRAKLREYYLLTEDVDRIYREFVREPAAMRKKYITCRSWYPVSVRARIEELFSIMDSSEEQDGYVENALIYLINVLDSPFPHVDIKKIASELNATHYGMETVKREILRKMAAYRGQKEKKMKGILLDGVAGCGKTTIAESIARALGVPFVKIRLGNVTEADTICGFSRSYKASDAGLIMKGLVRSDVCRYSVVMLLDEVDKMKGGGSDPYAALYDLLDGNGGFYDKFLECAIPTDNILFILTSNDRSRIPATILDRVGVVELEGYTTAEKKKIALGYVIPKSIGNYDADGQILFQEETVDFILEEYAVSTGVRDLEKCVDSLIQETILDVACGQGVFPCTINKDMVRKCLGPSKRMHDFHTGGGRYGEARALAVMGNTGMPLSVQVSDNLNGTGVEITGMPKESAYESVKVAMTVAGLCLGQGFHDLHIHFTNGGVAKDGPSAGITVFAALMSYALKCPLPNVAFTGELSLNGIHPIGGAKAKVIAAEKAGVEKVYLPTENYDELKAEGVLDMVSLSVIPVKTVYELSEMLFPGNSLGKDLLRK